MHRNFDQLSTRIESMSVVILEAELQTEKRTTKKIAHISLSSKAVHPTSRYVL